METITVGIREFREKLASYLESRKPVAILRHGETIGYFIPARPRPNKAQLESFREAAHQLDQLIASMHITEDQMLEEFKAVRSRAKKKRGA